MNKAGKTQRRLDAAIDEFKDETENHVDAFLAKGPDNPLTLEDFEKMANLFYLCLSEFRDTIIDLANY